MTLTKEPCNTHERALLHSQKSPVTLIKEPYDTHKRALLHSQKSPITLTKEAYDTYKRADDTHERALSHSQKHLSMLQCAAVRFFFIPQKAFVEFQKKRGKELISLFVFQTYLCVCVCVCVCVCM